MASQISVLIILSLFGSYFCQYGHYGNLPNPECVTTLAVNPN